MKKILSLILSLGIFISVTACSSDYAPTKETNSVTSPTVTVTPSPIIKNTTFNIGDTAVFKDLKISAIRFEESYGDDFFYPDYGNIYLGINFEIENISNTTQTISSILFFDAYVDDVKCEYSFMAESAFGGTLDGELSPGKKLIGYYAVEVPEEWQKLELEFSSDFLSDNKAKFVINK